jgi:hypothetical protein
MSDFMDPEQPRFETRASYMKELLAIVEQRGELAQRLEATSPKTLSAIREATRAEWLTHEVAFDMVRSLQGAVGVRETRAIYRQSCLQSFQSGILGSLFTTALNIFGPSPHLVAKFIPTAWNLAWRGCGDIEVEEARPGFVRLRHLRLPREADFDAFLEVASACMEAVVVGCRKSGWGSVERGNGRDPISYVLQWDEG